MKEHFQDFGVRKWAGDDLIELQAEPLAALQGLVAPYAPCILQGCEMTPETDGAGVTRYKVSAGLAALKGEDAAGNACVKIVRVAEETKLAETVYLYLACESKSRTYADGKNKVITYEYKGKFSNQPVEGALKISKDDGGPRLVDKLGITRKLNAVGGNARDVVVTFAESSSEGNRPELKSGSQLGLLLQQIRKWFDELKDLKALAFKDKVAKGDLTEELAGELNGKAPSVHSHEVATTSLDGFMSKKDKEKLNGIANGANYFTYTLPLAASGTRGGVQIGYTQSGRNYPVQLSEEKMYVHVPWTDTTYTHPGYTSRSSGLYKITVDSKGHVSGATAVTKSDITDLGIPGQDTNTTYGAASTTSAGLMSASDKAKLNNIADVTITISGTQLKFTWTPPNTRYPCTATLSAGGPSVGGGTTV